MAACPLLPLLLPLSGTPGIYGVALSGAGPSVLLITDPAANSSGLLAEIRNASREPSLEIIETSIAGGAICS
jgi:homoserine kinase